MRQRGIVNGEGQTEVLRKFLEVGGEGLVEVCTGEFKLAVSSDDMDSRD